MKYLQTYNESIRDLMTPKSFSEIESAFKSLPYKKQMKMARSLGIDYDVEKHMDGFLPREIMEISVERKLLDGVQKAVERGFHKSFALRLCSENGFYEGVKWLLENGANPWGNDSEALRVAKNNPSISRLIKEYQKKPVPFDSYYDNK